MTSNPHDKLFKQGIAADLRNLGPLVLPLLPPELGAHLDLDTAERLPDSFIDPDLSERFSDALFRVHLAGREIYLYLLAEHQSTVDPLMGLRLLVYMGRIWSRWLRDPKNANAERAPAILPLVFFQGPGDWTAATEFLDLIDLPAEQLAAVRPHVPSFRYALENLAHGRDEEIRARGLTTLGTLAMLLLKHARDRTFLHSLRLVVDLVNALGHRDDYQLIVSFIVGVADVESAAEVEGAWGDELRPEAREAIVTLAERLREEGLKEGQQRLLLSQLRIRFGDLPEEVEAQVKAGTPAELEVWGERFATAQTLQQVFTDT